MRIGIIGKFPPIQGGVSMRTYLTAHSLAAAGHQVHVVTNAKEVRPPFRMHMRPEDWQRCAPSFGTGSVTVHWSDPVDRSQSYIPMASPFVTKLATIAANVHAARPLDVIYSHYMEPYGVAGYLAAQMTGVPHVLRMAGSDAGRLWHHPQFEALYDHVLRSAALVVAVGAVADRAARCGVDAARIVAGGGYLLPEQSFTPDGGTLDFAALGTELKRDADLSDALWGEFAADRPHFGICGKLGDNKGSFALLAAMQKLKHDGLDIGLVALAHGRPKIERHFRERARELGLTDRVLQIPFLPHWRVPEFLRGCLAVCCLEQGFPIGFHSPIIPLEVLLCGACLVASAEVIRKLPQWERLPHGHACVAIEDVNDIDELSGKLAAIAREPGPAAIVGARGRAFAIECQHGIEFPNRIETILGAAAQRMVLPSDAAAFAASGGSQPEHGSFPLTHLVAAALADILPESWPDADRAPPEDTNELAHAQRVLAVVAQAVAGGMSSLQPLAQAIEIEIAIALAEAECVPSDDAGADPLFRVQPLGWALRERELEGMVPVRETCSRVLRFDHDISEFLDVKSIADFPASLKPGPSHIVVFAKNMAREPLLIDRFTARILELSDGKQTTAGIVSQLDREFGRAEMLDHIAWIENLMLSGLVGLRNADKAL